jgi:hypothetical protein
MAEQNDAFANHSPASKEHAMKVTNNVGEWWEVSWMQSVKRHDQREGEYTQNWRQQVVAFSEHEAEAMVHSLIRKDNVSDVRLAKVKECKPPLTPDPRQRESA